MYYVKKQDVLEVGMLEYFNMPSKIFWILAYIEPAATGHKYRGSGQPRSVTYS